jgi:hypothetical protein
MPSVQQTVAGGWLNFRRKLESSFVGQFVHPAQVVICDYRLGLLFNSLAATFLIIAIVVISGPEGYYRQEGTSIDANKAVAFWFEGAGEASDTTAENAATYCDSSVRSDFDYFYYAGNKTYDERFYDESSNECRSYGFGDVAQKLGTEIAFVATYMKETHSKTGPCATEVRSCEAHVNLSTTPLTPFRSADVAAKAAAGGVCTCDTMQNFFVLGADKVKLGFEHGGEAARNLPM